MELQPSQVDIKLAEFHKVWNLQRIQNMTLEEYADLNNHNSLCYWLEYETKELGAIGNFPLTKFGVWKPKEEKELKGSYTLENGYFYSSNDGNSLNEAFEVVRARVAAIVENAIAQNWQAIDAIKYNVIPKWKLVFLFSNKSTLPIYSRRALSDIVNGMGNNTFTDKTPISTLQNHILAFKNQDESIEDFAHRVYTLYAKKDKPNYYIIGSKYGDENGNDTVPMINEFIKNQAVAIGFLDWVDFSEYMGASDQEINEFVAEHWTSQKPTLAKIQTIFRKLSKIKEGDIIAVKSHGRFSMLTIIAYAEVVKRNGSVYEHNEDLMGHHIHVDFLDAGFSKFIGENYAETIHELNKKKDGVVFDKIFGWYANTQPQEEELADIEQDVDFESEYYEETGFAYNVKSEESFSRSAISSVKVNRIHNIIQNKFLEFLKIKYPTDVVRGEKNYIDARRETSSEVYIYEIKPYSNVFSCIRDGIGQLLDYSYNYNTQKEIKIYIVGTNKPNDKDVDFIKAIRSNLKIPFSYISFDYNSTDLQEH